MTMNLATRKSEGHEKKQMHLALLEHDGRALNLLTSKKLFQKRMKTLPIRKKCLKKKSSIEKRRNFKTAFVGPEHQPRK